MSPAILFANCITILTLLALIGLQARIIKRVSLQRDRALDAAEQAMELSKSSWRQSADNLMAAIKAEAARASEVQIPPQSQE